MKWYSLIFVLLLFTLKSSLLTAQNHTIDSLERALTSISNDSIRADVLSELTWKLRDSDLQRALNYGVQSIKLITRLQLKYINAKTSNYIGIIYRNLGDYNNAIFYYYRALKAAEESKQTLQIAYAYNNIGEIYKYQGKLKEAEDNTRKALQLFVNLEDKGGEAYGYLRLGEILQLQKQYTEAFNAYSQAVKIRLKIPEQPRIDVVYNRLGALFIEQKQYKSALEYLGKALETNLRHKVKGTGIHAIEANIARVYISQNKPDKAIDLAQKTLAKASKIPSKPLMLSSLKLLHEAYALKKEHIKAYEYQLDYVKMNQEFLSTQSRYRLSVLESIQRLEKKQNEIALERKDLELLQKQRNETILRRNFVYLLAGAILLLSVLSVILIRSNGSKQKANKLLQETNKQIDRKNQDITASIEYARRIQKAMLTQEENMKTKLPEHFILYRPRDIVSGDFYWLEEDEGKLFIIAADCTGHGVPGAFMTMLGTQALSNIVVQNKVHSPELILFHLDIILSRTLKSKDTLVRDGMDIAICVIDPKTQTMDYAGAKNPLIISQNGKCQEIKGDPISINGYRQEDGLFDIQFHCHNVDISIPTTFYIYSDGYQDQFGGTKGKKFMKTRFRNLLAKIAEQPLFTQQQILENTLDDWMQERDQIDDILVMGVKVGKG
ncbi:hypothetical protein BKI52_05390 [marine bacterium AO1-C]|nr:hypothetical protein BKI52_05390 [marine bacterium AO1-C]